MSKCRNPGIPHISIVPDELYDDSYSKLTHMSDTVNSGFTQVAASVMNDCSPCDPGRLGMIYRIAPSLFMPVTFEDSVYNNISWSINAEELVAR